MCLWYMGGDRGDAFVVHGKGGRDVFVVLEGGMGGMPVWYTQSGGGVGGDEFGTLILRRRAARDLGNCHETGGIVPFVNHTFLPRHCAHLAYFPHPKLRKISVVLITPPANYPSPAAHRKRYLCGT